MDIHGHHAILCRNGPDRTTRHNRIRDWLFNAAKDAMLSPIREAKHIGPGKSRPADVLMKFSEDEKVSVDTTVACPFSKQFIGQAVPLQAALNAERNKRRKYSHISNFIPFAIESTGGLGHEASTLIGRVFKRIAERVNRPLSHIATHYYRLLSVILQTSVAKSVSTRLHFPSTVTL